MVLPGSRPCPTSHLQSADQCELFRSRARGVGSVFSCTQHLSSWARRAHTWVDGSVQPPWGHSHCQAILPALPTSSRFSIAPGGLLKICAPQTVPGRPRQGSRFPYLLDNHCWALLASHIHVDTLGMATGHSTLTHWPKGIW